MLGNVIPPAIVINSTAPCHMWMAAGEGGRVGSADSQKTYSLPSVSVPRFCKEIASVNLVSSLNGKLLIIATNVSFPHTCVLGSKFDMNLMFIC